MSKRLKLANYIDGCLRPPHSDRWLDVFEPATGEPYADCPDKPMLDSYDNYVFDTLRAVHE